MMVDWKDQARSAFQTLNQYNMGQLQCITRYGAAKGWGMSDELAQEYARPYTNHTENVFILPKPDEPKPDKPPISAEPTTPVWKKLLPIAIALGLGAGGAGLAWKFWPGKDQTTVIGTDVDYDAQVKLPQ